MGIKMVLHHRQFEKHDEICLSFILQPYYLFLNPNPLLHPTFAASYALSAFAFITPSSLNVPPTRSPYGISLFQSTLSLNVTNSGDPPSSSTLSSMPLFEGPSCLLH